MTGDFSFNRISYHTDSDGVILKMPGIRKDMIGIMQEKMELQ